MMHKWVTTGLFDTENPKVKPNEKGPCYVNINNWLVHLIHTFLELLKNFKWNDYVVLQVNKMS